jgi:23S rRNA U2552 (ribose-2'-O)-methylase RlmE/FtsJ
MELFIKALKLLLRIYDKMKRKCLHTKIINNQFSMVSRARLTNLEKQCMKFVKSNYSFVECGVAKGGCLALMKYYAGNNNKIFGFDSFEGMPEITDKDIYEISLNDNLNSRNPKFWVNKNLSGGVENVYKTFSKLKIDTSNVYIIKGFFENTLKIQENIDNVKEIAILRLDADWYESTKICLEVLYDKVVICGVIIIDDYGYWEGAKKAVDEFRYKNMIHSPLLKTDTDEYYWIKTTETELCKLGYKYAVDKSPYFGNHTYTPHYHDLFKNIRNQIEICVEIGIGNTKLMTPITNEKYIPGASLRMWRDYFINAQIIGVDILDSVQFSEERISTYIVDQSSIESLENLICKIGSQVDMIIDDGSHIKDDMIKSYAILWKIIKPNGFYIIEDINSLYFDEIKNLPNELNLIDAKCILAYKGNFQDDNFIVFKKIN